MRGIQVAVIGDFDEAYPPHTATNAAINHSAAVLGLGAAVTWLGTESLAADLHPVAAADVLWCAPGSPYRNLAGALAALQFGRENAVPTLGTCGGCQHIILEYARNVLGYNDAQHAEYDPYATPNNAGDVAKAQAEMKQSKYDPGKTGKCTAKQCKGVLDRGTSGASRWNRSVARARRHAQPQPGRCALVHLRTGPASFLRRNLVRPADPLHRRGAPSAGDGVTVRRRSIVSTIGGAQ